GHAGPGEILVSSEVKRQVEGAFALQERALSQGAAQAERAKGYVVMGLQPQSSPPRGPGARTRSPFVGRGRELTMLHDLLAEVEAGLGQLVGIMGEPGMGKSRLLWEFRQGLAGNPVTYVEGHCFAYSQRMPYLPVLEILRQVCGISEVDTPEAMIAKVRLGLQAVGMAPDAEVPYLLHLLGVQEGVDRLAGLTPEAIKSGILKSLCQLMV